MPWFALVLAGILEVAWATGLVYTEGFTKPLPSVLTLIALGGSMWLLAFAAQHIPIGTAYPIWVGIGALGAALAGVLLFGERMSLARGAFVVLLVIAIVGIKITSAPAHDT
jgi:quaternary ammonium compound-resistance protein SugE